MKFKAEDFMFNIDVSTYPDGSPDWDTVCESIATVANEKLQELLDKSQRCAKVIGFNTPQEQMKWGYWIPIEEQKNGNE